MKLFGRTLPAAWPLSHLQPHQQRWVLTAGVALATLAIAQQGIVQPLQRRRAILETRLATAQQRIALTRTLETADQELAEDRRRLRNRGESGALLQDIAAVAALHDVAVNTVTPQPIRPSGRYVRFPIRVDANGAFSAIVQFLHALETGEKPLTVEQVTLTPQHAVAWADNTSRTIEAQIIVSALLVEP